VAARARGEGKTPARPIRIEGDLWEAFGAACEAVGLDRSAAVRAFMAWFARQPGAKMPKRPPAADTSGVDEEATAGSADVVTPDESP